MYEIIQSGDFHALGEYVVIRVSFTLVCWLFMVLATLFDFWSGISTARSLNEPLMSHGFRRTITKISDYWRVLLFALMFDILGSFLSFYYLPFLTMLCTLAIIIIEARSVIENSNRKRSHAAQVPGVVEGIVKAITEEEAKEAVKNIIQLYESHKKHD